MGVMNRLSLMPRSMGGRGGGGSGGINLYVRFVNQMNLEPVEKFAKGWTLSALQKIGAFVRTSAKSSIRRSKKVATPGNPPHAHGDQLKQIFYAVDPSNSNVVIGPVLLTGLSPRSQQTVSVPRLLEDGGEVEVYRTSRRGGYQRTGSLRRMRYHAFPFMKPALAKGLNDFRVKTGSDTSQFTSSVSF